jgi:hypothetical protein
VQAGGEQHIPARTEHLTHTALPPSRHVRLRRV